MSVRERIPSIARQKNSKNYSKPYERESLVKKQYGKEESLSATNCLASANYRKMATVLSSNGKIASQKED
jgi:hypothetical protein